MYGLRARGANNSIVNSVRRFFNGTFTLHLAGTEFLCDAPLVEIGKLHMRVWVELHLIVHVAFCLLLYYVCPYREMNFELSNELLNFESFHKRRPS